MINIRRSTVCTLFIAFGLCAVYGQSAIGDRVVDYAVSKEGKKVKRGECWDLVAEALDDSGADWVRPEKFGTKIDWESQPVWPGDIIEFRNVKIESPDRYTLQMPQHYAIVKEQLGSKSYRIIHQNYNGEKKVSELDIDLRHMVRGRVNVYRPID